MKRRIISTLLLATMTMSIFAGCSSSKNDTSSGGSSKVTLWATGSTNVQEVYQKLQTAFNNSQDEYQLEVQFILAGSGGQAMRDRVLAAHKAGQTNTDYDIVEVGDEEISVFLNEGGDDMLHKIDKSKVPNAAAVSAEPANGAEYVQAYRGTTVVLAYNSSVISNPPQTVEELVEWMKANPGRFAYNSAGTGGSGDSFIRSSIYNFLPEEAFMSDDEKWIDQWSEGFEFLKSIHPYMYKSGGKVLYPNKNQGTLDLLANREIDMCPTWADMALSQKKAGTLPEDIKIYQIEPSLTGAVNGFVVPKMGSNTDGAYAFINFMLSEEAQSILLSEMAAIPLIELDSADADSVKDLDVSNFRTQSIGELGKILNQTWDETIAIMN